MARIERNTQRSALIGDVAELLNSVAPLHLAQSWDNVGLLAGDPGRPCRRVLLCIDLTSPVLAEARRRRCDLILAYHPPLFRPISRLRSDSPETDAVVHDAIASGLAIYSPHTALDAAPGGTNDVLAGLCGLTEVEPFEYVEAESRTCKLVTFVPPGEIDRVASAMFAAGAGRIGDYEQCSYRLEGEGTFFGTESTDPTVGRRGRLETVKETRIEMIVARSCLPEVIDALIRTHSYEEPAYDVYPVASTPEFGIGRVGRLPAGTTLGSLARRLKRGTGSQVVLTIGAKDTRLERAAVCVGAAGRLPLEKPRSASCDVIVTGEIRHHDALAILRTGRTAVALGHWESERPVLRTLAGRMAHALPSVNVMISEKDIGPFARA